MERWPRTDLHLHATYYRLTGAQPDMTVANILRRTKGAGYATVGIVEHLDTAPKHPLRCLEDLVAEFRTVERAHSNAPKLYVGAELDYQGAGISIPEAPALKERLGLDYYLAAAHGAGEGVSSTQAYVDDHHRRLMGIVTECPYVDIVAHPWCGGHAYAARGLIEMWRFDMVPERYLQAFVDAAVRHGKAIEVNGKALADADDPAFVRYLHLLRESGARVTVGSDAHRMERVGFIDALNAMLDRAGLSPQRLWQPTA